MSFWKALALFSGLSVLMPLITDICLPAIPDIAKYYNAKSTDIQQTVSLLFFGAAVGQIIYGPLADRFGRKPIIVITMIVFSIISFLTIYAPSAGLHGISRFFQGATGAGGLIIVRAIIRDMYDGAIATKMLAYTMVGSSLMPILAPIVGGHVTESLGWKANFLIVTIFGVLVTFALIIWLKETGKRNTSTLETSKILASFILLLKSKIFLWLTFITLGPFAGLMCILAGLSPVLIDFMGMSAAKFGYFFAIIMIGNLLSSVMVGKLSGILSNFQLILSGSIICLISGLSAYLLTSLGIVTPLSIIFPATGFMIGFPLVVYAATTGAMAPFPEIAGKASSLIGLIQLGCGAATSLILGLFSEGTQLSLVIALMLSGILSIIPLWQVYKITRK